MKSSEKSSEKGSEKGSEKMRELIQQNLSITVKVFDLGLTQIHKKVKHHPKRGGKKFSAFLLKLFNRFKLFQIRIVDHQFRRFGELVDETVFIQILSHGNYPAALIFPHMQLHGQHSWFSYPVGLSC